ncbi:Lrp/AsnC family transcriptional regulator [Natrarchaeobius chitinivorans]|uniref:Lrp/AsnC family transcriptional regulator n=1 Tax=Natrarchaeobius chitinivorans TaxID=1679083 RepID=A0A3N6MVM8_NATCH|nr:Lrp/AsnC family transcriptional regulator [Natrarchaeobius chitinivorans]RQG89492.1 Lrp/AsnC family transcriptional regulator [Natrarchaeobius chitinivorans]
MARNELDDTDRGILYMLQQNARDTTTSDIGDEVGVSAGTVRNRIDRLEERGILKGYVPDIDYEKAGFELHILFTCTAEMQPSDEFVEDILDRHGVVTVRKLLAGDQNLHVEAVGTSTDDVSEIAHELEECGLEIVRSEVLEEEFIQPFNHFGAEMAGGE